MIIFMKENDLLNVIQRDFFSNGRETMVSWLMKASTSEEDHSKDIVS